MRRSRNFVKAPPKGWITKQKLLSETGVEERVFDGWAEKLGLKTALVSRGKKGTASYYPHETIATIRRLCELRVSSRRNIDEWIWRLWLEEHDVDICAWANKHVADSWQKLSKGQSKAYRFIFHRVRSPSDRDALKNYAQLAMAGQAGPPAARGPGRQCHGFPRAGPDCAVRRRRRPYPGPRPAPDRPRPRVAAAL